MSPAPVTTTLLLLSLCQEQEWSLQFLFLPDAAFASAAEQKFKEMYAHLGLLCGNTSGVFRLGKGLSLTNPTC